MLMSNSLGIPVSRFGGSSFLGTLLFAMYVPLVLSVLVVVVPIIVAFSDLSMSSSFFIVRASSDPPPSALLPVVLLLLLWRRRRLPKRVSFGDLFPFFRRSRTDDVGVVVVVVEHEQNRDDALRIIILCVCAFVCVCMLSLYIYICIVKECALCVLFFVSSANSCVVGGDIRLIFFVSLWRSFAHKTNGSKRLCRERERKRRRFRVARNAQSTAPRDKKKKKKIGFNCRPEESILLDMITKKGKKSACAPCGTCISSEKEKRDDARIFVFFRMELSLSPCVTLLPKMCAARVWCASGFFLREALKMWVLLIILTTRVRVFFGLYHRLRFLCLDLLVLTLRFGLSSVPA